MSSASPGTKLTTATERFGGQSLRALGLPAKFVGFWTAVVVPFVLLGLIASGAAQQSPLLLTGLLGVNVAGLLLGKDYKR